jgi:hypothetical protein
MNPSIKLNQLRKSRDDWGFFVPVDLETNLNKTTGPKVNRQSLIIISEEEKLKYYLKLHQPQKKPTVVVIKTLSESTSPRCLKNKYLKPTKEIPVSIKKTSFRNTYFIISTILSSGLFIYLYSQSMLKFKSHSVDW